MNVRRTETKDEIFEFLDGKEWTMDGVHGTLVYVHRQIPETAVFYGGWWEHTLEHRASEEGKRSEAYQKTRRSLRDDYTTDLTDAFDTYINIAVELGYGNVQ